jgi:RNA polymerase sigma-70 factor (ECF subfamily)
MLALEEQNSLPVAAARRGTPEAWAQIFQRYRLPLYVYLFQLLGNHQDSLDLVQETFVRAFKHLASLRGDEKFGSWLFALAHQKAAQSCRRPKPVQPLEEQYHETSTEDLSPDEFLIKKEQEERLLLLIQELSPVPGWFSARGQLSRRRLFFRGVEQEDHRRGELQQSWGGQLAR